MRCEFPCWHQHLTASASGRCDRAMVDTPLTVVEMVACNVARDLQVVRALAAVAEIAAKKVVAIEVVSDGVAS